MEGPRFWRLGIASGWACSVVDADRWKAVRSVRRLGVGLVIILIAMFSGSRS